MERADAEIVSKLRAESGLDIASIDDLVNTRTSYAEAYPVLLCLLSRDYPIRIREMIIRALTVPDARKIALEKLTQLYTESEPASIRESIGYESYRYALANAISVLADKTDRHLLKKLASERRYGKSRGAFIYAMRRWKDSSVDDIVLDALSDGDVAFAAIEVAGARHLKSAVAHLTRLADSGNQDVSRAAKRALKLIATSS